MMNVQKMETAHHTDQSFGNPDWPRLASAFGWHGHVVESSVDLQTTLEQAFGETGPSLVPVNYRENQLLTQRLGQIVGS